MTDNDPQRAPRLLEQLASILSALSASGVPVSAVNRPQDGQYPFCMIVIDGVAFRRGHFSVVPTPPQEQPAP